MARPADTLRQRLTRAALLPAFVVVAISGLFDYLTAVDLTQTAQDSLLLRTAVALATRMSPDEAHESRADIISHLDPEDAAMLRADEGDEIHFLVLDGDGEIMVGDRELLELAARPGRAQIEKPLFLDRVLAGTPVRVIDLIHTARGATQRVLVTETNRKRSATAWRVLFNTLWPNLLLLLVMMALMHHGTRQALNPLQSLGAAIDRRNAHDLAPVPLDQVPGEIRPFVTAINGMLDRLAKMTSEQQMFLSGAAHQLRTPLAGLLTQVELASRDATPELGKRLNRMHEAIDGLTHCTQQMLTLARSCAQASNVHDQDQVNLADLLEDAASNWLDVALRHDVELGFEVHPLHCSGSRWMLQEMLGNLIDNAIKHSPPGGHVTVRCDRAADGCPFLEVEDQGPGIAPADRRRVFEPFVRVSDSAVPGTGLGLAIAREVAERHDAAIEFLDPTARTGSRIRVTFRGA